MPITIVRWKSGVGGDTVLKMLLESNNVYSQNQYLLAGKEQTLINYEYVKKFKYDQIAKMSLINYNLVDPILLHQQLSELERDDPSKHWILKSHCYIEFSYPVIDIVVGDELAPFVIKASLAKNSRKKNLVPDYHPSVSKFDNLDDLYKFDCYNYSYDLLKNQHEVKTPLLLEHILSGWEQLAKSLLTLDLQLNNSCKEYYQAWLSANQMYLPSNVFKVMLQAKNWNYNHPDLSIEEKYCFLVLSNKEFSILS